MAACVQGSGEAAGAGPGTKIPEIKLRPPASALRLQEAAPKAFWTFPALICMLGEPRACSQGRMPGKCAFPGSALGPFPFPPPHDRKGQLDPPGEVGSSGLGDGSVIKWSNPGQACVAFTVCRELEGDLGPALSLLKAGEQAPVPSRPPPGVVQGLFCPFCR